MITVDVRHNIKEVTKWLDDIQRRQLPYAISRALTETAKAVKKDLTALMEKEFDRPTRYTLNSLFMQGATKNNLQAVVWLKDTGGSTPASKYLGPQIYGGDRNLKRFESALKKIGILPDGMMIVPGAGAQLDQHGNMRAQQIIQILSYFRAFGQQGYSANITDKKKARIAKGSKRTGQRGFAYFAGSPGGGKLPLGIYQRFSFSWGSVLKPVMIFVKPPKYMKRYHFFEKAEQVIAIEFPKRFEEALRNALATAR